MITVFVFLLLWSAATPVAALPSDAHAIPGATVAIIRANRIESVHATVPPTPSPGLTAVNAPSRCAPSPHG